MQKNKHEEGNGDPVAERNRRNGSKSRGPKTENGRQATDLSKITHGARSKMHVIPGVESATEWKKRWETRKAEMLAWHDLRST
jgi:hypothetical protein